jgi:2-dehydropantoate 2-reductase
MGCWADARPAVAIMPTRHVLSTGRKGMRLLVVDAGSTGGYFGGRLAEAGRDVTFLVRPRRAAQLQATGLNIVSPHGDVTLRPKLVTADAMTAPYDAVLLAVKAYSLDAAIEDFAAAVGPRTAIIPTLNGMRHIDILAERFGEETVAGGVCKVAATIDPEGRILQFAAPGSIEAHRRYSSLLTRGSPMGTTETVHAGPLKH